MPALLGVPSAILVNTFITVAHYALAGSTAITPTWCTYGNYTHNFMLLIYIFHNWQSWFPGMYWCVFHPEVVENTWWIRLKGPHSWTLQLHLYTRRRHQVYGGLCSTLLITEAPPHRKSKLQLTRGLYGARHAITKLCTQPLQRVICFCRWKTPESQYTIICGHCYYGPALSPRPCSLGSEHVLCQRKAALCHRADSAIFGPFTQRRNYWYSLWYWMPAALQLCEVGTTKTSAFLCLIWRLGIPRIWTPVAMPNYLPPTQTARVWFDEWRGLQEVLEHIEGPDSRVTSFRC